MRLLCSTTDQSNPKLWGYFDWPFMWIYKQGSFLSKNQIWISYRKKSQCSTYRNAGYWNFRKNVKIEQSSSVSRYLQNLKYNVKRVYIFHFVLVGIPPALLLSVRNREGEGVLGLLNRQDPLSMTKVICGWSLKFTTEKSI